MITNTELYDIGYVFTLIRQDIKNPLNIQVLTKSIEAVNHATNSYQINNVRKYLSQIDDLNDPKWHFVFVENFYTQPASIIKNVNINKLISDILESVLELLVSKNYEQAYDLSDLAHAILEILANFNGSITKSYWKHHVNLYRKKWDKEFLMKYQKNFSTKG